MDGSLSADIIMIGLRASRGRVSINPVIVSAGPTITLSMSSSVVLNTCRSLATVCTTGLGTLCFGIGGAIELGTSNSQNVIFSELRLSDDDMVELVDKLTRLDADVTLLMECGLSIRFTELSTLGDDFRGGKGGAI